MLCATWSHPNRKRALKCRKKMHTYGSTLRYKRYTHTALRKVAPYAIHIAAVHVMTMVIAFMVIALAYSRGMHGTDCD